MSEVVLHHAQIVVRGDSSSLLLDVEVVHDDGTTSRIPHLVPGDVFEIRAAEYGLDLVADLDEVIEIVLLEPYLPAPVDANGDGIPDHDHPRHLYQADTLADARAHLRERIAQFRGPKKRGGRGVRGVVGRPDRKVPLAPGVSVWGEATATEDPIGFLKRSCPMDPDHMALRREMVAATRAEQRAARNAPAASGNPLFDRPTAAEVADRMHPRPGRVR